MTKEELKAKVAKQQSIINDANNQICSDVKEYIESLPYKVGDKVSCSRCDVCWIKSIVPDRDETLLTFTDKEEYVNQHINLADTSVLCKELNRRKTLVTISL